MLPLIPSSIGTIRGWMRENIFIATVTENRQYFGMPERDRPETPFIIMYRVGGAPDDFGQDYPQLILECWGGNKHEAESLGLVVAREVQGLTKPVRIGDAWLMAGEVNVGPIESSGTTYAKRYRIDATFHLRSAI